MRYDAGSYNFENFLAANSLNLYLGYGEAWDEDGNVIGRNVWWAKLIPDTPLEEDKARAISIGLGRTAKQAVENAIRFLM
jgi:hypothetical protein